MANSVNLLVFARALTAMIIDMVGEQLVFVDLLLDKVYIFLDLLHFSVDGYKITKDLFLLFKIQIVEIISKL